MDAQVMIRSSNVLLITMRGLGNEVAKNLVLAGIGSLTMVDPEVVTEADLGAQFFLTADDVGKTRAMAASPQVQKLNPRVRVLVDQEDIRAKDPSFFALFDMVIATDLDTDLLNLLNVATRIAKRPFYAAGVHGMFGFIFNDLIEHDYVIRRDRSNLATQLGPETRTRRVIAVSSSAEDDGSRVVEQVTKRELYSTWFLASDDAPLPDEYLRSPRRLRAVTPALPCFRALWAFQQMFGRLPSHTREDLQNFTRLATQKHAQLRLPSGSLRSEFLRSFLQNLGSESAPVTAMVGGQLAQDVVNVLGHTQQPIQNMVIIDGTSIIAPMYPLHPEGELGAALLSTPVEIPTNGSFAPGPDAGPDAGMMMPPPVPMAPGPINPLVASTAAAGSMMLVDDAAPAPFVFTANPTPDGQDGTENGQPSQSST